VPKLLKRLLGWFFAFAFIALTTAAVWLPFVITHAVEKDYHFPEVAIDATVHPNGDLALEDRRTFDFRNGPFTYAYFDVQDGNVTDFSIAEMHTDGSETPVTPDYAGPSGSDSFEARWSFNAEDENRTWIFRYTVPGAVDAYRDTAHLYWQFIGTGWSKPTSHAVITVHLPPGLTREQVRAFGHGPLNGDVTIVDPQTIRYDVHDVPPFNFVEASILFPTSAVPGAAVRPQDRLQQILAQEQAWADQANATRHTHDLQRAWVLALLLGVPLVLALFVVLAYQRDRIAEVPKLLEQPPEDDAVQAALLVSAWRGHLSPQSAYRTEVLRLARTGAIEIRSEGLVTAPKDLTLVKKKDALDLETQADQDFMMLLFGSGEDAVDEVSVLKPKPRPIGGEPRKRYTRWWEGLQSKAGDVLVRITKGDARIESTGSAIVAISAAAFGVWTATFGLGGPVGWWLVPVSALSLIVALRIIPARVDRPLRERIWKLAAFRRYLAKFSDLPNAPALAVIIWEQYLEWAVALGVADLVEKQVKALVPVESLRSPIPGGPTGLQSIAVIHNLNAAASAIVISSMVSANSGSGSSSGGFGSSSSSSGFSGGGFSGGGGGGGGGTGGGAG
jgi:uncharacterized membrane protein YgcG